MDLFKNATTSDLTTYGYWGINAAVGGYCLVSMVLVPLVAVIAGGYLATTGQYVVATTLTVGGIALGVLAFRERTS